MEIKRQLIPTSLSDRTMQTIWAKPLSDFLPLNLDRFLRINGCGFHKVTEPYWRTVRDKGLPDYQLIYMWNGWGDFRINGQNVVLEEGNFLIYKPNEPQIYNYYAKSGNENYWIHFSGHAVQDLLKDCGFWDKRIFKVGKSAELANAFDKIIQSMLHKRPFYEYEAVGYFCLLMTLFAQTGQTQQTELRPPNDLQKLFPAINAINENYSSNLTTKNYADICNLSPSRFTHLFTQSLGMSPNRYKHIVRIEHAKDMLAHTRLSIHEISAALGYEDPFYFSRRFSQIVGCSPREYRSENT